jgi:anti-sigma B factor antagonist
MVSDKEATLSDRSINAGSGLRRDPILGVDAVGEACVVRLGGELDLYNAPQVREALNSACAASPERVVIDLEEVEFIDSTGLGVLIEAKTKLDNRRAFLLASPALETRRALQISGLDRHFTILESVSDALSAKL